MSFEAISAITSTPMTPMAPMSTDLSKSVFAKDEAGGGFGNVMANAMNSVSTTMNMSKELGEKVATGDVGSLHQLSVAGMKSEILLKLTTQIASKLSSAATTLFQMQM